MRYISGRYFHQQVLLHTTYRPSDDHVSGCVSLADHVVWVTIGPSLRHHAFLARHAGRTHAHGVVGVHAQAHLGVGRQFDAGLRFARANRLRVVPDARLVAGRVLDTIQPNHGVR